MFILFLCLQFELTWASSAADQLRDAAGNVTFLQEDISYGWQASSYYRGTSDILWSCLVTIFACVYTAIHLDAPSQPTSQWKRLGTKLWWAGVAIVAPELVVISAIRQWRAARKLLAELHKLTAVHSKEVVDTVVDLGTGDHSQNLPSKPLTEMAHTMVYAFWIVMGGFALDGALLLAELGLLPELAEEQIEDRSKANIFAKVLVCLQACWLVLQCIVRHYVGYPLTLLEIHSVVHVVCALLIYILWLKKPLDVQEPIMIGTARIESEVAMMVMATIPHRRELEDSLESTRTIANRHQRGYLSYDEREHAIIVLSQESSSNPVLELRTLPPLLDATIKPLDRVWLNDGGRQLNHTASRWATECLSPKDIRCWILAAQLVIRYNGVSGVPASKQYAQRYGNCISTAKTTNWIVGQAAQAWEHRDLWEQGEAMMSDWGFTEFLLAIFLPIVYGGIHLLAWNFTFPSLTEHLLWKISGIAICAALPAIICAVLGTVPALLIDGVNLDGTHARSDIGWISSGAVVILLAFVGSILTFYALCRIYLVVEALISLRQVPIGVFAATPWLQSIPHI